MASRAPDFGFNHRRGKSRLRVGIPAALVTTGGRQTISLVDLSESGARLMVSDPGPIGDGILKWNGFEAYGSVVRRSGDEVALQFEEPIDPAWLLDTRHVRPACEKTQVRRFAREWATGDAGRTGQAQASPDGGHEAGRRGEGEARGWLGTAMPFVLGAIGLGTIAGYCSIYF